MKFLRSGLLLGLLALAAPPVAYGQSLAHYRDQDWFHFGFVMGLNVADARTVRGQLPLVSVQGDTLMGIRQSATPGVNIGLIANLKLSHNLDLRFVPVVSLQQRNFQFDFTDGTTQTRKIEASYLELPLLLKYKSDVYKNYRVYVITGPQYSINLSSDERVLNDPTLLRIVRTDFSWRIGFGMNLYGDRVKLSPEISYAFGLRNVYVPGGEDIPGALQSIYTSSFIIAFNFEQ